MAVRTTIHRASLVAGVAIMALLAAFFPVLVFWAGEDLRHESHDWGDAAFGWLLAFGLVSASFVVGAALISLALPNRGSPSRRVAAVLESGVGSIGVVWLGPIVTIPIALAVFALAGRLRRLVTDEQRLRRLDREGFVDQAAVRYIPYVVGGVILTLFLWLNLMAVVKGGACHADAHQLSACEENGSLVGAFVAIALVTGIAGTLLSSVFRIRGPWPRVGSVLLGLPGLSFGVAVLASHLFH